MDTLAYTRDVVALELDLYETGKVFLSGIVDGFDELKGKISNFSIEPSSVPVILTKRQNEFVKELSKINFVDSSAYAAFFPEGLNCRLSEYSNALIPAVEHCKDNTTQLVDSLIALVSGLISGHGLTKTADLTRRFNELEKSRIKINVDIGKCFQKDSVKAIGLFSDIVDRNSDWQLILNQIAQINKTVDSINRNILHKKYRDLVGILDAFQDQVKSGKIDNITPEATNNLASLVYCVACEIEFFGVIYYRVMALNGTVNKTIENTLTMLEK